MTMTLRVARTLWWLGTPTALFCWLLAPRRSVIEISVNPFSIVVNPLPTALHPVLDELIGYYPLTAWALILSIVITIVSHARETHAVRTHSLALPSYLAAIEAGRHFEAFGHRHTSGAQPMTLDQLHFSFCMAALASLIAVVAPLLVAAALVRWRRSGTAGRLSWLVLCGAGPLASVAVIWFGADRIFFRGPS